MQTESNEDQVDKQLEDRADQHDDNIDDSTEISDGSNSEPSGEPDGITLGGTKYTIAEATDLIEKGLDYTRKRQRDAELVNYGKQFQALNDTFASGPDAAREVIEKLSAAAREAYGEEFDLDDYNDDTETVLTPQERRLITRQAAKITELERTVTNMRGLLEELQPVVAERAEAAKEREELALLKGKGLDITLEQLRAAKREASALSAAELALIAVQAKERESKARKEGYQQAARKPVTAEGINGKAADLSTAKSADEIFQILQSRSVALE